MTRDQSNDEILHKNVKSKTRSGFQCYNQKVAISHGCISNICNTHDKSDLEVGKDYCFMDNNSKSVTGQANYKTIEESYKYNDDDREIQAINRNVLRCKDRSPFPASGRSNPAIPSLDITNRPAGFDLFKCVDSRNTLAIAP